MKVTLFPCGPVANESELLAFKQLESRLQSLPGDGEWILLTNLAFSVTHHLQSDEIDIVAIGPCGVRVIEVKHWTSQWADAHSDSVIHEAEKVTEKARKVGTTMRKLVPTLPRVDGTILLTQEASKTKKLAAAEVRGVTFHSLTDWKAALGLEKPGILTPQQIRNLGRALEPKTAIALDGSLRRFAGYVNLELTTPKEERFHRVYKGVHSTRQDRVVLHLYDLSLREEPEAEAKARREFEALQRLQLYAWAPRILDSFQDAPGYAGEMFFFTIVDPAAPSIQDRSVDASWSSASRVAFAKNAVAALQELHAVSAKGPLLHRNLTTRTILVKHDNSAILTGFDRSKISSDVTVASLRTFSSEDTAMVAPEIRNKGLGAADSRSDIYSLCACLSTLFPAERDATTLRANHVLRQGMAADPNARAALHELDISLSEILGQSAPPPSAPPARFWTEDQMIRFRDRDYRIVAHLGSGGVGATFKVVEIDRTTKEDLGTYVAKVAHDSELGHSAIRAYGLARAHLGRHSGLSVIFEIAREWNDNSFTSLMTWIDGAPLRDFLEVFPLLAEDQQESSAVTLAIRWVKVVCNALAVLHRNGLVHGDVSPRNLIVSGTDLVLTDYDFVARIGETVDRAATLLYCSPSFEENRLASPSDDIYALAASFFHVMFNSEPFLYGGVRAKEKSLNWDGLDRGSCGVLAQFFDKATDPDPARRFASATEVLALLDGLPSSASETVQDATPEADSPIGLVETTPLPLLRQEKVDWLRFLLQSYPGSPRWGNRETRGLDTSFAADTYVKTRLEDTVYRDIIERRVRLVVLCGNAGDGKTALLQHLAGRLGFGVQPSSQRILEGITSDGLLVRMNLDGSAAWLARSADDILNEFLAPFQQGPPTDDIAHVLAINDGRLLEWIGTNEIGTPLTEELCDAVERQATSDGSHIRFINLNERSLVGNITADSKQVNPEFLDRLLDQLYGGERANETWAPCVTCQSKTSCEVFRAARLFGPTEVPFAASTSDRSWSRQRLIEALQAVHLRGASHVTVRELRAALVYILFGVHFCSDYHEELAVDAVPFWDRAFSPDSPDRQGEVLGELTHFDPALEAHPQLDRYLLSPPAVERRKAAPQYTGLSLDSAIRRAFFEWKPEQIEEIAGSSDALGLARGRNLKLFRNLPFDDVDENRRICARVCRGISQLEDLPLQALDRKDVVPLRITPRTPTETIFWVEKQLSSFRLEPDVPGTPELDRLHRQAFLVYRYRNGDEERLRLGAEVFHLLLELSDGYQLGDISTDDTFAHLSIFVQRLIREDERELLVWSPMRDDLIYKTSTSVRQVQEGNQQRMLLAPVNGR